MENTRVRNAISILVIITMIATMITLPALSSDNQAFAASKTYKVKFKANGGKFAKKAKKSKSVTKKKKYGKLPAVTKKDAIFTGWYTKKVGGKKITAKTKVSKKYKTLYAQWKAEYDISKYTNVLGKGASAIPVATDPDFKLDATGEGELRSMYNPLIRFEFEKFVCVNMWGKARGMITNFNDASMPVATFFNKLGTTGRIVESNTYTNRPDKNWYVYEAKVGNAFVYVSVSEGKVFYDDYLDCYLNQRPASDFSDYTGIWGRA